jgi:glycerol-3-phosphate acyltransferase PlsY
MQSTLLILGSFLLGSLPFSLWVARRASGADLRTVGSGNPGATNVLRVAGIRPATLALLLDVGKGVLPVAAAINLLAGDLIVSLVAVAAISGHILSPFLGLRGGKGVATSAGALAVLNPWAAAGGVLVFLALVLWKRYVSLASMVGAIIIAILASVAVESGSAGRAGALASAVIAILVLLRHLPNIKRLMVGQEPRLGEGVTQT